VFLLFILAKLEPFLISSTTGKDHKQGSPSSFPQEMKKKYRKTLQALQQQTYPGDCLK